MTKEFEQRVLNERMVDTDKYRYVAKTVNGVDRQYTEIRRIEIDALDTTASLGEWELVKAF